MLPYIHKIIFLATSPVANKMLRLLGTTFCTSEQHLKAAASCQLHTALRKIHVLSLAPSSRHLIDKSKLRKNQKTLPHNKTNVQREGEKNIINLLQSRDLSNATTRTSERALSSSLSRPLSFSSLSSLARFLRQARERRRVGVSNLIREGKPGTAH